MKKTYGKVRITKIEITKANEKKYRTQNFIHYERI